MEEVTIISYPGPRKNNLLSMAQMRSRYMMPFGGRSRVVDFTIRNSMVSGARKTIIFNNWDDDLEEYVENYGPFKGTKFPPIKVVSRDHADIKTCYELILDSNTDYYIMFNGDNASYIDFAAVMAEFKKKKKRKALLFKMNFGGTANLAHTILVTNQKLLLEVINSAMDEGRGAPNVFDMIINIMLNRGIDSEVFNVLYWPVRSIPEYYAFNMSVLRDQELFRLLYADSSIKSWIRFEGYARLGVHSRIQHSLISDHCNINGTVINSIIFPGVFIGEKTVVRDSIILPAARIGAGARITRTIIDERTDFGEDSDYLNIGDGCAVGEEREGLKNNDFPRSLFGSVTLIGKDCRIPDNARIGGACYVASGLGAEYFEKNRALYDGLSVT